MTAFAAHLQTVSVGEGVLNAAMDVAHADAQTFGLDLAGFQLCQNVLVHAGSVILDDHVDAAGNDMPLMRMTQVSSISSAAW